MTAAEFESTYEAARDRAIAVCIDAGYPHAVAEDAAQAAAVYFIERLDTYQRVTPALFIHKAARCARDVYEAAYGSTRPNGKAARVTHVGSTADVAEFENASPVYTAEEDD